MNEWMNGLLSSKHFYNTNTGISSISYNDIPFQSVECEIFRNKDRWKQLLWGSSIKCLQSEARAYSKKSRGKREIALLTTFSGLHSSYHQLRDSTTEQEGITDHQPTGKRKVLLTSERRVLMVTLMLSRLLSGRMTVTDMVCVCWVWCFRQRLRFPSDDRQDWPVREQTEATFVPSWTVLLRDVQAWGAVGKVT